MIIDSSESFQVTSVEHFVKKLGIMDYEKKVKVVAIFGNSGDGKSHTLNNIFFDSSEVKFKFKLKLFLKISQFRSSKPARKQTIVAL